MLNADMTLYDLMSSELFDCNNHTWLTIDYYHELRLANTMFQAPQESIGKENCHSQDTQAT